MDIPEEAYHQSCDGASSSALKVMLRSPAHYKAYLSGADSDSAARMFGRALHCQLLERQLFLSKFAVWDGGRRAGRAYESFVQSHPGKTILTEEEHTRTLEAALQLRNCADFPLGLWLDGVAAAGNQPAIAAARCEFSVFWTDEETGVKCKARIDAHARFPSPLAIDVKSTDDVRPTQFYRQFMKLDYDLQAAHYSAALKAFYGEDFPFLFAAVETHEPHAARIFGMDADLLANGEAKRRYALRELAKCEAANHWPANETPGIHTLHLGFSQRFERD